MTVCSLSPQAAVRRLLLLLPGLAALLAPALWNGFAVVFYDTGGYVDAALRMHLVPGRSLFYGLFLWLGSLSWWSFWGPILVQSLATLWLIYLLLRCHDRPHSPGTISLISVGLAATTGLAWYTSQLMPDILVPLVVLCLWLLGFRWERLSWPERCGLALLTLFALLSHMSCLALGLGLMVVIMAAKPICRRMPVSVHVLAPTAVVLSALVVMPALHKTLTGTGGLTPGGPAFLFGRLVQDGLAARWLKEHCPVPGIKLCAMKDRMPTTADYFLWGGSSPFKEIGDWKGNTEPELKFLTRQIIRAYPTMLIETSLSSTLQQIVKVSTGDALHEMHLDTRGILTTFLPTIAEDFNEARQQQGGFSRQLFDRLNLIHVPVSLAATFCLPLLVVLGLRTRRYDLAALALFTLLALLGNAFICGVLSNPHDRYQSRLVWLAPLVVITTIPGLRRKPC